jgi:hypothetical protein
MLTYLERRGSVGADARGIPLVTGVGNCDGDRRLSRRGVRTIVEGHLRRLELKRPRLSNHALRHTGLQVHPRSARDEATVSGGPIANVVCGRPVAASVTARSAGTYGTFRGAHRAFPPLR